MSDHDVSRRGFLRMSLLCTGAVGVMGAAASAAAPGAWAAAPSATVSAAVSSGSDPQALTLDGNPRFLFQPVTPVPGLIMLGSLEDVWASPRYATYTDCVVTYVGDGPFVLTAAEQAVVDVVAGAGGEVADPQSTYLTVVAASTRLDPARLTERLAEIGAPIVRGSLALAPFAPQAVLFGDWLATQG